MQGDTDDERTQTSDKRGSKVVCGAICECVANLSEQVDHDRQPREQSGLDSSPSDMLGHKANNHGQDDTREQTDDLCEV